MAILKNYKNYNETLLVCEICDREKEFRTSEIENNNGIIDGWYFDDVSSYKHTHKVLCPYCRKEI